MSNVQIDEKLFLDMVKYLIQHPDDSFEYLSIERRFSQKIESMQKRIEYKEQLKKDTN